MDTLRQLHVTDLAPGDVLLHMGKGELSKLIAWVGDSRYSHAALVTDNAQLIEAAASGVRRTGLAERPRMTQAFHYIDVFRPLRPAPHEATLLTALLAASDAYLGRPYPMTTLFTLGIVCAVRNKMPGDAAFRRALRMALDLVIDNDASKVVCSELVYRGFDEAQTAPPHALRLAIGDGAPQPTALPSIDIEALWSECLDDYQRSRPQGVSMRAMEATPDTAELDDLLAQARATLGLDAPAMLNATDAAPNPKTVLPADLEFSPSLQRLGRLTMAA